MRRPSINLLYNDRKRLPEDKDFGNFILQEVLDFCKRYRYIPENILVRKDDYGNLVELKHKMHVNVSDAIIPIYAAGSIQVGHIYIFPYVKNRIPVAYNSIRSPI